MRKITFVFSLILISIFPSWAGIVTANFAQQVAQNFYNNKAHQGVALTLAYTATNSNTQGVSSVAGDPVYYVFNAGVNKGFVIVSAESLVKPVLAYSLTGAFSASNMATATTKWLANYQTQILNVRYNDTVATVAINKKWADYYNNNFPTASSRSLINGVSPLCLTQWNQEPYYNDSCPYDQSQKALTVTGCVATAMAQIMKYWNYPAKGNGSTTDYSSYGDLSVNFADRSYNWAGMPNSINSSNPGIAQLMYDCGVAVGMDYGVSGSGAQDVAYGDGPSAQKAYSDYFGYDGTTIQGLYRQEYSDSVWMSMLEAELDSSRLIEYGGYELSGEGHSWVCDGYDGADTLFHMNWGWGGSNDAYYSIDNLDPSGLGGDNLNTYEDAIIGIQPVNLGVTVAPVSLALSNNITFSQSPYVMNTPLTVYVQISNNIPDAFSGSFIASIYDSNGNKVTDVEQYLNIPISAGKDTTLAFTTTGVMCFPGNYTFGVLYKTAGRPYALIPQSSFSNPAPFTVAAPANILVLDSSIGISTGSIATSTPFQVTAYIENNGADFSGTIGAELFDMNDDFIALLDSVTGTILFAGANAQYTFNCSGLNITPGQYQLAIYSENGNGVYRWTLVGDSFYTNPVLVQISPALAPDIYEVNNTLSSAYVFSPLFDDTVADVVTYGANMHIGTDIDYYTLNLPQGIYTITAQVFDSQNPRGSETYTNDVQFSFSTDDSTWSPSYDDAMPAPYKYTGGPVTFLVTDLTPGTIGTYVLDVKVTNNIAAGVTETNDAPMSVYPNPAHDAVVINPGNINGNFELAVYDLVGNKLLSKNMEVQQGELINENLAFLDNGMYILRLLSSDLTRESKVVINH